MYGPVAFAKMSLFPLYTRVLHKDALQYPLKRSRVAVEALLGETSTIDV